MTNLKILLTLAIGVIIFHSCNTPSHRTGQFYSNVVVYEAIIDEKKVLVINEKFSSCGHRSYVYNIDKVGAVSEWTDVSIYNCLQLIGQDYDSYLDLNTFFETVRLELKSQQGVGD